MTKAVVTVKFFASLREYVGQAETEILASDVQTVAAVWLLSTNDMALPENTLMAVNMEYVDADYPVRQGDEVAFFPPVTGG